jgi:hypothetical protein
MKGYDSAHYASTRLDGTVIRKGNRPIYVNSCGEHSKGIAVNWEDLIDHSMGTDLLDDLDINPVPLGYANHDGRVTYLTRMPMRQDWKQGLRDKNTTSCDGFGNELSYGIIARTILGEYPRFSTCLEKVGTHPMVQAMAFSRDFAIVKNGSLTYKGLFNVGSVIFDTGAVNITDSFSWVREAFSESMESAA